MKKLQLISPKDISINDKYWNKYLKLVKEEIIPYQWSILNDEIKDVETSHAIMNLKIAAGLQEGQFYGAVFQDTDVAKWLEAVAYILMVDRDKIWEKRADYVIDLIQKAQWDDGYINTYYTLTEPENRFTNLREGHELYTSGHLMEAAVAYYRATGKDVFLNVMIKNADLICSVFSKDNYLGAIPGHQEIEIGLFKLYEVTGNEKYLKQAKDFLERRGKKPDYFMEESKRKGYHGIFPEFNNYDNKYSQAHIPVREQRTAEGHCVRATYMYSAMADVASEYNDHELLCACDAIWNNIVNKRMYITGSIGSSGLLERFTTDYDLPNNSNYSETCASIGLALFSRRMAQCFCNAKYIDVMEYSLYNTLLSGIAMDGKSFFYVNPLEVWPQNCIERTSKEHVKPVRQKWFGVACCPPNIARTLAALGEYIAFKQDDAIYINLFVSSHSTLLLNGHNIVIDMITDFPNDGLVQVRVTSDLEMKEKLYIRIPGYVKLYKINLNGYEVNCEVNNGYLEIILSGTECNIIYNMDISARAIRSNPKVKDNVGKVAFMKGPVVYCMEQMDNKENLPAYQVDPLSIREEYREDILGGTTILKANGLYDVSNDWKEDELYSEKRIMREKTELLFVPYPYWCNRTPGEMLVWIREIR